MLEKPSSEPKPAEIEPTGKVKSAASTIGWICLVLAVISAIVMIADPRSNSGDIQAIVIFFAFAPFLVLILSLIGLMIGNSAIKKAKKKGYKDEALKPLKRGRMLSIIAFVVNLVPIGMILNVMMA